MTTTCMAKILTTAAIVLQYSQLAAPTTAGKDHFYARAAEALAQGAVIANSPDGNVTIRIGMISRKSAVMTWTPDDAFIDDEYQVVFAPEDARYRVVMSLSDVIGNSVQLQDLRPYTYYRLEIRKKIAGNHNRYRIFTTLSFSTAVVNPSVVTVLVPEGFSDIRVDEILIVCMVLLVWAAAVYIFFNQWGKIRGIIPYQPAFRQFEVVEVDPEDPNCTQCDNRQTFLAFEELMINRGLNYNLERSCKRNHSAIFIAHKNSLPEEDLEAALAASSARLRKTKEGFA